MPSVGTDVCEAGEISTTAEPFDLGQEKNDCLLHKEHHTFDTDCYDYMVVIYRNLRHLHPQDSHAKLINRYFLMYEEEVLHNTIRKFR